MSFRSLISITCVRCVYFVFVRRFFTIVIVQLEKTPEYDRIRKLLNQPIRPAGNSYSTTNPVNPSQTHPQQRQQSALLQGQQLKQRQLKQQQQQKNQQEKNRLLQQQQYNNALGRNDRISSTLQQNRSVVANNNTFGIQNTNRRINKFRVRVCQSVTARRRSVSIIVNLVNLAKLFKTVPTNSFIVR